MKTRQSFSSRTSSSCPPNTHFQKISPTRPSSDSSLFHLRLDYPEPDSPSSSTTSPRRRPTRYIAQDAHNNTFAFIYFLFLTVIGSFFLLNVALAVVWDAFQELSARGGGGEESSEEAEESGESGSGSSARVAPAPDEVGPTIRRNFKPICMISLLLK